MGLRSSCIRYKKMLAFRDGSGLKNCMTEAPALDVYSHCSVCQLLVRCRRINCGHQFCVECLTNSVVGQLSEQRLVLKCPVPTCQKYINPTNLPQDLLRQYLVALQHDLQQKKSSGVSFAWRHKRALAINLSRGYAVYIGFSWRKEMGYALKAIRFGSEVKSLASSFKKLVKSGSHTLTSFKKLVKSGSHTLTGFFSSLDEPSRPC